MAINGPTLGPLTMQSKGLTITQVPVGVAAMVWAICKYPQIMFRQNIELFCNFTYNILGHASVIRKVFAI